MPDVFRIGDRLFFLWVWGRSIAWFDGGMIRAFREDLSFHPDLIGNW